MPFIAMTTIVRRCLAALVPAWAKPSLGRLFRNVRFRAHTHIGRFPVLFFGLHRLLGGYPGRLVDSGTDMVIEGAPRVASTYCATAFLFSQERPVTLATHTHLPANVLRAAALAIPTLVVIREPDAAVRSALLRNPDLTPATVLERYEHFYRPLLALREKPVIADFEAVTADLGAAIERVNARYGTAFDPYLKSPDNEAAVNEILRQRDRLMGLGELGSYAPNRQKEGAKARIDLTKHAAALRRCEAIYRRLSPSFAEEKSESRAY